MGQPRVWLIHRPLAALPPISCRVSGVLPSSLASAIRPAGALSCAALHRSPDRMSIEGGNWLEVGGLGWSWMVTARPLVDWKAHFLREEFVNRFLAAILVSTTAAA